MPGQVVLQCESESRWLRFSDPIEIVEARQVNDVLPKLRAVEDAVHTRHLYAAGFIAYEAAPAFDAALRVRTLPTLPLLWLGLYERVDVLDRLPDRDRVTYSLGEWIATVPWGEYERAIDAIKNCIADGETYQVNYTYRLRTVFTGDAWNFFVRLVRQQPRGYAAFVDTGRYVICSASPELFFQLAGRTLTAKPMKGTAARGRTLAEDRANQQWLHQSEKNRAENVMIVDMLRNDLGRIAEVGSVNVPTLFEIERYPTVLQMTSTVTAKTTTSFTEILTALFPCASITGAPKTRTMSIIADLETTPRGVYTGCVGYLSPHREAQFNVAIRTVTLDRDAGTAEYGVGGGIVWDSDAVDEYRECEIKTRVLGREPPGFDLIESILWTPDEGYFLRERHVQRLADSAEYFGIPIDEAAIRGRLASLSATLERAPHKIRLCLSQAGAPSLSATPLRDIPLPQPMRVALARDPVDSNDLSLYHKTTRRRAYETARAVSPGYDDVILWNERGEITESTIANVVIDLDGELITPPIECGLLAGVFRAWLVEQHIIHERVTTLDDFKRRRRFYLINSVRKWMRAMLDH